MGRQKKNELDAILEQLKKSYATDIDTDIEENSDEAYGDDDDSELASVLEQIFASEFGKAEADAELDVDTDPENVEAVNSEYSLESHSDIAVSEADISEKNINVSTPSNETGDAIIVEDQNDEAADTVSTADSSETEEQRVDDVLRAMLGGATRINDSVDEELTEVYTDDVVCDDASLEKQETIVTDMDVPEPHLCEECEKDEKSEEAVEICSDTESVECISECENEDDEDDEEIFLSEGEELAESVSEETSCNIIEDDLYEELDAAIPSPEIDVKIKITDPSEYVSDILQQRIDNLEYYMPGHELDLEISGNYMEYEENSDSECDDSLDNHSENEVADKDVSLLMRFGYDGDAAIGVGTKQVRDVIVEENNAFSPSKHCKVHGYVGQEYSNRSQKESIDIQFRKDKIFLLILSIISSLFAIVTVICDFMILGINQPEDYVSVMVFEIILIALLVAILHRRLYSGILSLIRFEFTPYSLISVLLAGYTLYCIVTLLVTLVSPETIVLGQHVSFGGYVLFLGALTVWAEYLDSCREHLAFNVTSEIDDHFVLERVHGSFSSTDRSRTDRSNRYAVRRAATVSGFFRRIHTKESSKVNFLLVFGVVPTLAIILGITVGIITDSAIAGARATACMWLSTAPLSTVIVPSLVELINAIKLARNHSAFIGTTSPEEYAKAEVLEFKDTDAVEIVSLTEINPGKQGSNSKKWVNIANNVLRALGGPVAEYLVANTESESNVDHEIIINSISENGIDLYFDSSVNVLIGDRIYMQSHNINVKTNKNLSTAIKGNDRSVIYVAFDGTPQVGYIVTSKIKDSFVKTVTMLAGADVRAAVSTYEPQINHYYFEINNPDIKLIINKPAMYSKVDRDDSIDSGIVAATSNDLCNTLLYSREIVKDRKKTGMIFKFQILGGVLLSLLMTALMCLEEGGEFVEMLQKGTLPIFYIVSLLLLIPNAVHVIKKLKRK